MQVLRVLRLVAAAAVAAVSVANAAIAADDSTAAVETVADILSAAGNATDLPGGNSLCTAAQRVRRPWGALDEDDQALYLEAVSVAVQNGALKQFADLYADEASGAQASYSSAFFLWHRRLVLGFESYLRGLDPKFACLTVPYYDVHTAYVRSATQECGSLFECSGIFKAFGGEATTAQSSLLLNGLNVTGVLHKGYPFEDDCDDSDVCGEHVRNDLTKRVVPPSAGFSSFQSLIASTSDYASFLEGIQFGIHNEVRDAVGGALATFASPRDVFFYSWHAALDMYLHTYQLCRIGVPLSEDDFKNSTLTFPDATDSAGGIAGVGADSKLVFNVKVNGSVVDISEHPTFGKYFGYVGDDIWNYGDVQQLGDYSYTYELPEVLRQQLLTNADVCTGFNRAFAASANVTKTLTSKNLTTKSTNVTTTRTVTTTVIRNGTKYTTTTTTKTTVRRNTTTATTSKNSTTSLLRTFFTNLTSRFGYIFDLSDDDSSVEGESVTNGYTGYNAYAANGVLTTKHSGLVVANVNSGVKTTVTTTKKNTTTTTTTTKYATKSDATYRNVSVVRANVTVNGVATLRDVTASVATTGEYWLWLQTAYDGLKERFEGNIDLVAQHLQLLELRAYESIYGSVANLSTTFVKNTHLTSARSVAGQLVDEIKAGKYVIAAESKNFSAKTVQFVNTTVIKKIVTTYKRIVTRRNVTYLNTTYVKKAETAVKQAVTALIKSKTTKKNSTIAVVNGGVTVTANKTTVVGAGGEASTTTSTTTSSVITPAPVSTSKAPSTKAPTTKAPVATPATGTTTTAPAATPATGTTTKAPAATPATGGATQAPAATPATGGATQAPAATPATGGATQGPAATPATGGATKAPAATPAASATKPAATPAATTPIQVVTPAATPAATTPKQVVTPAATPAASTPKQVATPATTPAASTPKQVVTPSATPAASATKPAVTPAASNIIKVVVTPAPTSPKLIC